MLRYTISEMKKNHQAGWIKGFCIRHADNGKWVVTLKSDGISANLETARGDIREFTTVEAAIQAIRKIGFEGKTLFYGGE